jgi:hypothetical protein
MYLTLRTVRRRSTLQRALFWGSKDTPIGEGASIEDIMKRVKEEVKKEAAVKEKEIFLRLDQQYRSTMDKNDAKIRELSNLVLNMKTTGTRTEQTRFEPAEVGLRKPLATSGKKTPTHQLTSRHCLYQSQGLFGRHSKEPYREGGENSQKLHPSSKRHICWQ